MDGADASTTFADETGKTWTPNGNAQIDTSQSKFGGAAGLFDGSGDWIDGPSSADFTFGTGDFTLEAFVYFTSSAVNRGVFSLGSNWTVYLSSDGNFYVFDGGSNILSSGSAWGLNTWNHVAVCRAGGTIRLFKDGTVLNAAANSMNMTSSNMRIGSGTNGATNMLGSIDEVRITKGVGRYTANFTPPTAPFPDS